MQIIRKYATLPVYPYHGVRKKQKILAFPLQFYTRPPVFFKSEQNEVISGAIGAFHSFIVSLCSEDPSELESIVEWNLLQRLKSVLSDLKKSGHHLHIVGSQTDTQGRVLEELFRAGCLLPYRNLNFQEEIYVHSKRNIRDIELKFTSLANQPDLTLRLKTLAKLNLKEMNQNLTHGKEKELKEMQARLGNVPLYLHTMDIGIVSRFKVAIKDANGKVIDGSKDDSLEFHSLRLEMLLPRHFGLLKWLPPVSAYCKWFMTQFEDQLQWTIVDVDGFMGGNELTKPAKP
jgi:hypothetical protein